MLCTCKDWLQLSRLFTTRISLLRPFSFVMEQMKIYVQKSWVGQSTTGAIKDLLTPKLSPINLFIRQGLLQLPRLISTNDSHYNRHYAKNNSIYLVIWVPQLSWLIFCLTLSFSAFTFPYNHPCPCPTFREFERRDLHFMADSTSNLGVHGNLDQTWGWHCIS